MVPVVISYDIPAETDMAEDKAAVSTGLNAAASTVSWVQIGSYAESVAAYANKGG